MTQYSALSKLRLDQSGQVYKVPNALQQGSGNLSVAYANLLSDGAAVPTASIVVYGGKNAGKNLLGEQAGGDQPAGQEVILDTYTGPFPATRTIALSDTYDYFGIIPTFTGGLNVRTHATVSTQA